MSLKPQDQNKREPSPSAADHNYSFYSQFLKIYTTSYHLALQIRKLVEKKETLAARLAKCERREDGENTNMDAVDDRKDRKRNRRTAQEIEKKHVCPADRCGRSYGSQGSLMQHLKLKHPHLHSLASHKQYDSHMLLESL